MNSTGRTIAKNASVLMASQVITWILTLILTIFLPRYLGPAAMGKLYLANSLWAVVGIFAIFGMDMMIIKAVARTPEKTPKLFGNAIYASAGLFILGALGVVAYAHLAGYPRDTRTVIYIVGLTSLFLLFELSCESVLKGMERMEYVSLAIITGKTVQVGLTILMLFLRQSIYAIAAMGALAALAQLAFIFYWLRRTAAINLRFGRSSAAWMLKESLSYLLLRMAMVFYQQVDIIVISLLANEQNIGWYGSAGQLFGTFIFVPTVFITVLYPVLARMFTSSPDAVVKIMRKSFDLMWVIAMPIGLGVFLIANPLVKLLYGPDFYGAGPVLELMGIVTIVTYQNMLLGQFLISTDRQRPWSWVIGIGTLATIPLDLILVPWCQRAFGIGALGGSLSFLATETFMAISALYLLPRGTLTLQNLWRAVRTLAAGLVMVAVGWWTREMFILVPVVVGAVVYLAAVVAFQAIPREDWALLRFTASALVSKLRRRGALPVNASGKTD